MIGILYDKENDEVYLPFEPKTQKVDSYISVNDDISIDFDKNHMILGIKITNASNLLPQELLKEASNARVIIKLTKDEFNLLTNIINKRNHTFLNITEDLGSRKLTSKEKDNLQQMLMSEMVENGLKENDEPNDLGKVLDSIIGKIEYY